MGWPVASEGLYGFTCGVSLEIEEECGVAADVEGERHDKDQWWLVARWVDLEVYGLEMRFMDAGDENEGVPPCVGKIRVSKVDCGESEGVESKTVG
ncbi:unnamed protein product [Sphenostylis stenocarpa]|uniref:Uncharacterized protein n=1 Tax=Sphenostylis stenocarpa TaxID=92480 RepID=A0AA86SMJ1_9FABA|nr:unnamed protein product [Sphenostylis stenocarpa]